MVSFSVNPDRGDLIEDSERCRSQINDVPFAILLNHPYRVVIIMIHTQSFTCVILTNSTLGYRKSALRA